ncbi:uncharacterized protein LOC109847864 [Asparagus officinalis]|uniref:uncharacterized protein LOC109847864 n=1 Tax=Asparagus officinalis TaxID=4686 RepID=UPI00098E20F5|nr:uncharacterized protein LOC109847864 [Asparagus officinalis]
MNSKQPPKGERGLRQGDPLSPYLFILGILNSILNRSLDLLKLDRNFKFHPKCGKLKISHLIFADDLLLFSKGDLYSVQKLKQCISHFSSVIGLDANPSKSAIFYVGVDDSIKDSIQNCLGFSEGNLPIRYLGVPLVCKRLSFDDCRPLFNKIFSQFQNWLSHRHLSYAGRLQIIKSVILGVQLFWTSSYILPKKVLYGIDKLCRDFLWGKADSNKPSLVSWDVICRSKDQGGLGIFSAVTWNTASALKIIWFIHTNKELLWIKWIHGTYLKHRNIWQVEAKVGDSWMWKQILKIRDNVLNLCGGVSGLLHLISSCIKSSKLKISALYHALLPITPKVVWRETVWEGISFPKHSFVLWLAILDRLLTQDKLLNRGVINRNCCILCSVNATESRNHLFFACCFSSEVWNGIMDWLRFNWRSCAWNLLLDWYNIRLRGSVFKNKIKRMALAATVYSIWMERNVRIFTQVCKGADRLIKEIKIDILSSILNSKLLEEHKDLVLTL